MADQTVKMRLVRYEGKKKTICYPQTTADQILGLDTKLNQITGNDEAKTLANTALTTANEAKTLASEARNIVNNLNLTSDQINQIRNLVNSDITDLQNTINNVTTVANVASTNATEALGLANGAVNSIDMLNTRVSALESGGTGGSGGEGGGTVDLTSVNAAIEEVRTIATNAQSAIETAIQNNSSAFTIASEAADRVSTYDTRIDNINTTANTAIDAANNAMTAATTASENTTNALLSIDDLRSSLTETNTNVSTVLSTATNNTTSIEALNTKFNTLEADLRSIETNIGNISSLSGFTDMTDDINEINSIITVQNQSISSILDNISEHTTMLTNLNVGLVDQNTSISSIREETNLNSTAITSIRTDMETVNTSLESMNTSISSNSNNIADINNRIESTSTQTNLSISSILADINDIKEDLSELAIIDELNNNINAVDQKTIINANNIAGANVNIEVLRSTLDSRIGSLNEKFADINTKLDYLIQMSTSTTIANVPTADDIKYVGYEQKVELDNFDIFRMSLSGVFIATEIGSYSAIITPKDGFAWIDDTSDSKYVNWNIIKGELNIPEINDSEPIVYTGSSIAVPLEEYDETNISISGDSTAINAGTYEITATVNDTTHYSFATGGTSSTLSWTINRAPTAIAPSQKGTILYDGTFKSPTWQTVVDETNTADGYDVSKMSFSGISGAIEIGIYSAIFSLNDNYAWVNNTTDPVTVNWSIIENTEQGGESSSTEPTEPVEQGGESSSTEPTTPTEEPVTP